MIKRMKCLAGVVLAFVMAFGTAFAEENISQPSAAKPVYVLARTYDDLSGKLVISVYLRDMPSKIAGGSLGLEFAERLGDYTFQSEEQFSAAEMFYSGSDHKHFFHYTEAWNDTLSGIDATQGKVLLCTYTFNVTSEIAAGVARSDVSLLKFDSDENTKDFAPEVIDDVWLYDTDGVGCYQGVPFVADDDAYDNSETFCIYLEYDDEFPETSGVTVKGKIRSYDPKKVSRVCLVNLNNSELIYTVNVADTTGKGRKVQEFEVKNVPTGRYALKITKPSHLSYTKQTVVIDDNGTGEVILSGLDGGEGDTATLLCGDINGDGRVKLTDRNLLLGSKCFGKKVTDEQSKLCDLDGDGYVKLSDLNIMMLSENFNKCDTVIP